MTHNRDVDLKWVTERCSALRGEYVWGVRSGEDMILRMDFGLPHLVVREPQKKLDNQSPTLHRVLRRRAVIPTGQWHLFIEDGFWSIKTEYCSCTKNDGLHGNLSLCFSQIDGQKLIDFAWDHLQENWILHFDLGGSVSIRAEQGRERGSFDRGIDAQWSIFQQDGHNISWIGGDIYEFEHS